MYVLSGFLIIIVYAYGWHWLRDRRTKQWEAADLEKRVVCMNIWKASKVK